MKKLGRKKALAKEVLLCLTPEIDRAIEESARHRGVAKSAFVREALRIAFQVETDCTLSFFSTFISIVACVVDRAMLEGWIETPTGRNAIEAMLSARDSIKLPAFPFAPRTTTEFVEAQLIQEGAAQIKAVLARMGLQRPGDPGFVLSAPKRAE